MKRIAVAGGGITGLAAAHRLEEARRERSLPIEVRLLEAGSRLGGVISTVVREGCLIEEGPDSILTEAPWGRELAERIGLGGRLIGTRPKHRRSFVARRGRLEPTPDGFYLLAPTRLLPLATTRIFSPLGKARMAMDLVIPRRRAAGDESVGSFVMRRLGREALERIAQPMIGGIYGADPFSLSLRATLPRFAQMEREHGSVIRGMMAARRRGAGGGSESDTRGARYGLFVSFDQGLQVMTETLSARLPPGAARLGCPLDRLSRAGGAWRVEAGGASGTFDAVIVALPAPAAARVLREVDERLGGLLASIPYGAAATVSLAFRQEDVSHPMDGFGFVAPAVEGLSILGCTFVHRKYPGRAPEGQALLRAFWGDRSSGLEDAALIERTLSDIRRPLGIRGAPTLAHVVRHPDSMPQYAPGHLELLDRIDAALAAHAGLALAGNAYRGVGIPHCIRSGEAAAESVIAQLGLR